MISNYDMIILKMEHTGLSVSDEIGIVVRPWVSFFLSWTSTKSASPSVSGKLE